MSVKRCRQLENNPVIIPDTQDLGRVGDALCALPYLLSQRPDALGAGLNRWVYAGLHSYALPPLLPTPAERNHVTLNKVFHYCQESGRDLHMAQGWFALNGLPVPELPLDIPFITIKDKSEHGYVVVSPFSASDFQNNKLWPLDRWATLIQELPLPVVVLGTGADIGWGHFTSLPNVKCMIGNNLPGVLNILRHALCVVTIDNGISHLCHFGGVTNHALLKPACLAPGFVANPRSPYSLRASPLEVPVSAMLDLTHKCLGHYDWL